MRSLSLPATRWQLRTHERNDAPRLKMGPGFCRDSAHTIGAAHVF